MAEVTPDATILPQALGASIGGVITSGLLTLVVVPVIYTYLDDLGGWARRIFGARRDPPPAAEPPHAA